MKKYNVKNYIRWKEDVKFNIQRIPKRDWVDYSDKELITLFLPLVENISRKFSTAQEASGTLSILDIIQEGSASLIKAVGKLDRLVLIESEDQEKTLKSFLAKRIKGGIRQVLQPAPM